MTLEEIVLEMGNPELPGTVFNLQNNLAKYLQRKNDAKVRAYVCIARAMYPDFNNCPVSLELLKMCTEFLQEKGWVLFLAEDNSTDIYRYVRRKTVAKVGDHVMVPRSGGGCTPGTVIYASGDMITVQFPIGDNFRGGPSPYAPDAMATKKLKNYEILVI